MNDEIKEILDYFWKDVDKYKESKKYLMQKYGYTEKEIDNLSQHERHINTKKLLDYITNLQNNWYDLKTYCKLERHESNSMKEAEIYNEIITKMEQLERGE